MTQHEHPAKVRVVPQYELDTLGAPFKVTLRDAVSVRVDPNTGETKVKIPDLIGLMGAIVRRRASDPRKLSGEDIRFIRKTLGVQAKKLAKFLDVAPEHFSKWESSYRGSVMPASTERQFRLFAFAATLYNDPEKLLERSAEKAAPKNPSTAEKDLAKSFFEIFINMKIDPVGSAGEEAEYVFVRCTPDRVETMKAANGDEGDWKAAPVSSAA